MRRIALIVFVLVVSSFILGGCAMVSSPVTGGVYNGAKAPLTAATDPNAKPVKTGTAVCESVLGIAAFGDCSIDAAKKNGGITKISTIDYQSFSILVFYAKFTTTITGE